MCIEHVLHLAGDVLALGHEFGVLRDELGQYDLGRAFMARKRSTLRTARSRATNCSVVGLAIGSESMVIH